MTSFEEPANTIKGEFAALTQAFNKSPSSSIPPPPLLLLDSLTLEQWLANSSSQATCGSGAAVCRSVD